jgi:hypothetical protein
MMIDPAELPPWPEWAVVPTHPPEANGPHCAPGRPSCELPPVVYEAARTLASKGLAFEAKPPIDRLGRYFTIRAGGYQCEVDLTASREILHDVIVTFVRTPIELSCIYQATATCPKCGHTVTTTSYTQESAERNAAEWVAGKHPACRAEELPETKDEP